MTKNKLTENKGLLIGVDLGIGKDTQCATLNLYYNETNHIIYQTSDKEQVMVLNEIAEEALTKRRKITDVLDNYMAFKNDDRKPDEKSETLDKIEKALKNGIWNGVPEHIQSVGLVYMLGKFYFTCFDENGKPTGSYALSEYKKTWWLEQDRSE